ncbi:hypothetical protein D6817_02175 [Candidatus Pacearchaeota archaeon]|nr:MAG: hypothetical protein D6817_02175 [Candidatus Pacearchaeota archaeon]
MLKIVYSPSWFYPADLIIDIFSMLILALIAFLSFKYYKIRKGNKNYFWLSLSFSLLAVSFLFKLLTNFTIYRHVENTTTIGFVTITIHSFASSNLISSIGFLGFRFLMLLGLFILYRIYQKSSSPYDTLVIVYLIAIITYFSREEYFVFHLTSLIFLSFITSIYYKNYKKSGNTNSQLLFYSFTLISVSQLAFMMIESYLFFYIVGEIVQLAGYLVLLITLVRIIKHGKKK